MCTLACLQLKCMILELKDHITLLKLTQHFPEGSFIWSDVWQTPYPFKGSIKGQRSYLNSVIGRIKSACYLSAAYHKYFSSPLINTRGLANGRHKPDCPRIAGTWPGTIFQVSHCF